MSVKCKAMKTLAVVTAAGALTVGGATAAVAADGSGSGSGISGATATTAPPRLRSHPAVRQALHTAFGTAADTLGTTAKDLRGQMVQNHESLADVAGDKSDAVASAIVASLSGAIDQAVANGHFPADRVDQAKARLPQLVERLMNRVPGQRTQ